MFLEFARNRSNSADAGIVERLAYYGKVLGRMLLPGPALAIAVCLATIGGLVRGNKCGDEAENRYRRLVLAAAYMAVGLAALARHEYQLSRNMVGPTLGLLAALGWGLRMLPAGRHTLASAVILLLVVLSPLTFPGPYRSEYVQRYYPLGSVRLDDLSLACDRQMAEPGLTRIVGTFNEFSPGWVKILAMQSGTNNPLAVGVRCPLPRSRTGYPEQWLPEYGDLIEAWGSDGTRRVLVLGVAPDSPYDTHDYELWNAWKLNLLRALDESPDFAVSSGVDLDCGVGYTVFVRKSASSAGP
ncbi:hypothetical protein COW53_03530 [bacterium CG17_big_fil_post_rev_8_21_14_2_50_64_8]|nr:MAG: hypothetical protein COW53_03530 [bacterium CG17_big_fil_post_rev_8_21_14_2_50_64_8]PJA75371.1 MAG: hypothetical protein CO151_06660 [bacterium CG_4_9_14_3_um_filter_65_15]